MSVDKFVSKMSESDLNAALDQSEQTMSAHSRVLLVEAIFDAFRGRGESSEDAAEAAGADLTALANGDESALRTLIGYAKTNQGLLKEAAIVLIEEHPEIVGELAPALRDGVTPNTNAQ